MQELIKYFTNLLILQYRNKRKARATIEALTQIAFSNDNGEIFPIKVQNAYDLDTATGHQLDILGKYLGKDRKLNFSVDEAFKMDDYDAESEPIGYSEYEEELHTYPYAEYRYSKYEYANIGDENYKKNT